MLGPHREPDGPSTAELATTGQTGKDGGVESGGWGMLPVSLVMSWSSSCFFAHSIPVHGMT